MSETHPTPTRGYDAAGCPLRRIGNDDITPEALATYGKLFSDRTGTACNGNSFALAPTQHWRGYGYSLGYRYSHDIR
jgi:hypothetical protein